MKFYLNSEVPIKRIGDLLCCAFEGGSTYWASAGDYTAPNKWEFNTKGGKEGWSHEYPLNPNGAVEIIDMEEGKTYVLDNAAIMRGWKAFSEDEPKHHLADLLNDNEDAVTGDVFLQCCIFGKSIYG